MSDFPVLQLSINAPGMYPQILQVQVGTVELGEVSAEKFTFFSICASTPCLFFKVVG